MITIHTDLDPTQEIIIAAGLAEVISNNPEVVGVTVVDDTTLDLESRTIWAHQR